MSIFWNIWIIGLTVICLALIVWVLLANRKVAVHDDEDPENRTTGHVYDGIEEYDNPLPRWWFNLFVITLVFGAVYLIYYPGLGSFKGLGGWTSTRELAQDQEDAREDHAEMFTQYLNTPIEELVYDAAAMKMGVRLFANNCAVCHGADGGGNYSFPNLTDNDWLFGGAPEKIKESITQGRNGNMPGWGMIVGEPNVQALTEYVLQLSGQAHDADRAQMAETLFAQNCAACHGANGAGNQLIGAPNLTDDIWLYEGSREAIAYGIRNGRANVMPAQAEQLQPEKIHLLAAYVFSLSYDYE